MKMFKFFFVWIGVFFVGGHHIFSNESTVPVTFEKLFADSSDTKKQLTFDNLFPESVFTVVLNDCMKVWGELNEISENNLVDEDAGFIGDTLIGKLVSLSMHVNFMAQEYKKVSLCSLDDIEYLVAVLHIIETEYLKVMAKREIALTLIRGIKVTLLQMTEG